MLEELNGRQVVIDVQAQYVYVGRLEAISPTSVLLVDVDVHDLRDSNTTRERYVLDTKLDGIRANRRRVYVQQSQIVSISALDDILE
ncbi:MAG: hypothetical protein Fues2KO_10600 [Fuerstiella sp.]|jgi:small nuclear ribonucleoprotein (snRNP)-like protein